MKRIVWLAIVTIPLVLFGLHCSAGSEPEVVNIPVGESGTGDPFDTGGALACGEEAVAASLMPEDDRGEAEVLVAFIGTGEVWAVLLTKGEFLDLMDAVENQMGEDAAASVTRADIDAFHAQFCGGPEERTEQGDALYGVVESVLGEKLGEIETDLCG